MLLPETLSLHNKNEFCFHYIYFLPWKDQMVVALKEAGGHVTCFPANNNISMMRQASSVKQYISDYQIDIVHCHLPWSGFLGRYISKSIDAPVIYTEHNKQERYHGITRFLNKFSFNRQSMAIAVSSDVADSIQNNIHPSIPVSVIRNGVNTQKFIRNASAGEDIRKLLNIGEDTLVIGTIAVFRFQKRLKEWLRVFKRFSDEHKDVHAVIVGEGLLRNEIETTMAELDLKSKVTLAGLQSEVRPWLSAMDIFMMSSVFEGLPIALLEAMSMECAIVTTDAGGIREVIRNGTDGFMVPVDKWEDLKFHLDHLAINRKDIPAWGKKARERVIGEFSLQKMVDDIEALYKELHAHH